MLTAMEYLGEVGLGATSPQLFRANDQKVYVVKLQNNRLGPKVLVNEYFAARFGAIMGLCFPASDIITLGPEIIRRSRRLTARAVRPGVHFACQYLRHARYVGRGEVYQAVNKRDMAGVILFDHMFHNLDRTWNRKNILIRREPTGWKMYAIDNSHLFRRGRWDAQTLARLAEGISVNHRRAYGLLLKHFLTRDDFLPYLDIVNGITRETLQSLVDDIPQEWLNSVSEREALVDFSMQRCSLAPAIVDQLAVLTADQHRRADVDQRK